MQIVLLILLVIFTILVKIMVPPMLIRRAVKPVIERFLHFNAFNEDNAKTIQELGLGPRKLAERLVSMRDYKPKALDALISASIVLHTEEGKFYLSKNKLMETKLLERWPAVAQRIKAIDNE